MSDAPSSTEPERCLDCGTVLQGEFCHVCGQRDRDFHRPLWGILREALHETFDLDGRFARTLRPFFFRPGELTRQYLAGRRVRYTSPLRLFLFASLLFFAVASPSCPIHPEPKPEPIPALEDLPKAGGLELTTHDDDAEPRIASARVELETGEEVTVQSTPDVLRIWLVDDGRREYRAIARPVEDSHGLDALEKHLSRVLGRMASRDPGVKLELAGQLLDNAAKAAFLLVPLYALVLLLVVRRPKRSYVEHLVMSLHVHTFVFVALTASLLIEYLLTTSKVVADLILLAIVLHVVLAFRRAYGSSLGRGLLRAMGAFGLYLVAFVPLFVGLVLASMLMLDG